jgi:hypothetical protein
MLGPQARSPSLSLGKTVPFMLDAKIDYTDPSCFVPFSLSKPFATAPATRPQDFIILLHFFKQKMAL